MLIYSHLCVFLEQMFTQGLDLKVVLKFDQWFMRGRDEQGQTRAKNFISTFYHFWQWVIMVNQWELKVRPPFKLKTNLLISSGTKFFLQHVFKMFHSWLIWLTHSLFRGPPLLLSLPCPPDYKYFRILNVFMVPLVLKLEPKEVSKSIQLLKDSSVQSAINLWW